MLREIGKIVALSFAHDGVLALRASRRLAADEALKQENAILRVAYDRLLEALAEAPKVERWLAGNPDGTVEDAVEHFTRPFTDDTGSFLCRRCLFTKVFEIPWPLSHELVEKNYDLENL